MALFKLSSPTWSVQPWLCCREKKKTQMMGVVSLSPLSCKWVILFCKHVCEFVLTSCLMRREIVYASSNLLYGGIVVFLWWASLMSLFLLVVFLCRDRSVLSVSLTRDLLCCFFSYSSWSEIYLQILNSISPYCHSGTGHSITRLVFRECNDFSSPFMCAPSGLWADCPVPVWLCPTFH